MNPAAYGHDADMDAEANSALKIKMRVAWVENQMPKYMGFFQRLIEESGGPFVRFIRSARGREQHQLGTQISQLDSTALWQDPHDRRPHGVPEY